MLLEAYVNDHAVGCARVRECFHEAVTIRPRLTKGVRAICELVTTKRQRGRRHKPNQEGAATVIDEMGFAIAAKLEIDPD